MVFVPSLAGLGSLSTSPITGVHLWFDRPVCPFDHVVTIGRQTQWVFNHTAIQGRRPGDAGGRVVVGDVHLFHVAPGDHVALRRAAVAGDHDTAGVFQRDDGGAVRQLPTCTGGVRAAEACRQ